MSDLTLTNMTYVLYIENDTGETLTKIVSPTFEMLSEKVGAWERSQISQSSLEDEAIGHEDPADVADRSYPKE